MKKHFDRRMFMKNTAFACAAGILPLSQLSFGKDGGNRLNILLLVAEGQCPHLGCYGDKVAQTPNIDRFAAEGVRFTKAYVTAASCSPSRASMLTGLYPQQHGQIGLSFDSSTKKKHIAMKRGIVTVPQLLKKNGYFTGVLGKIHVDPHETIGFDFRRGCDEAGGSSQSLAAVPMITEDGKTARRHVRYSADIEETTRDASEFFAQSAGRPFFLMVNFSDTHTPFYNQVNNYPAKMHKPEEFTEPFKFTRETAIDYAMQQRMAAYYNGLARLDASVGQILDALDKSGQSHNTLVFYLADHGPEFDRGKLTNYEGGMRVPFLMRYPGQKLPHTFDGFIASIDIMPTALEAADVAYMAALPGKSLLKVLTGKEPSHDVIYGDFNRHSKNRVWPMRSVRLGDYKLIYNPFAAEYKSIIEKNELPKKPTGILKDYIRYAKMPEYEFYNLSTDPYELKNLASDPQNAEAFQQCLGLLKQWQKDVGDYLLNPEATAREQQLVVENINNALKA